MTAEEGCGLPYTSTFTSDEIIVDLYCTESSYLKQIAKHPVL